MTYQPQPQASHFIDGAYVEDTAGAPIPVIFAADGEEIARLHAGTPAIVDRAITAAQAAQKDWAKWLTARGSRELMRLTTR